MGAGSSSKAVGRLGTARSSLPGWPGSRSCSRAVALWSRTRPAGAGRPMVLRPRAGDGLGHGAGHRRRRRRGAGGQVRRRLGDQHRRAHGRRCARRGRHRLDHQFALQRRPRRQTDAPAAEAQAHAENSIGAANAIATQLPRHAASEPAGNDRRRVHPGDGNRPADRRRAGRSHFRRRAPYLPPREAAAAPPKAPSSACVRSPTRTASPSIRNRRTEGAADAIHETLEQSCGTYRGGGALAIGRSRSSVGSASSCCLLSSGSPPARSS